MNTKPDLPSRGVAARIYKWVLAAQRPLLITELCEGRLLRRKRPLAEITPDHILKICSNFLLADTSQVVQFCHLSAREFLEKRQTNSILDYSCDLAHAQAAISSLAFLNRNDIIISPTPELNFSQNPWNFVPKRNFSEYARDFVMFHIKMSGENRKQHPLESMLLTRATGSKISLP
jgi:hypothetical protein